MTYQNCKNKLNAGAWKPMHRRGGAGCLVFFGPSAGWHTPDAQDKDKRGICFVLDKVPVNGK
jgi:hypothetical protein